MKRFTELQVNSDHLIQYEVLEIFDDMTRPTGHSVPDCARECVGTGGSPLKALDHVGGHACPPAHWSALQNYR